MIRNFVRWSIVAATAAAALQATVSFAAEPEVTDPRARFQQTESVNAKDLQGIRLANPVPSVVGISGNAAVLEQGRKAISATSYIGSTPQAVRPANPVDSIVGISGIAAMSGGTSSSVKTYVSAGPSTIGIAAPQDSAVGISGHAITR